MPPKRKRAVDGDDATTGATGRTKRVTRGGGVEEVAPKKTKVLPPTVQETADPNVYSDVRFDEFFKKHSDDGQGQVMNSEAIQTLFTEADISLEGVSPFLLAWICKASEFGSFKWEEWERLRDLRIDTAPKLKAAVTELENFLYKDVSFPVDTSPPRPIVPEKKSSKSKKGSAKVVSIVSEDVGTYRREAFLPLSRDKRKSFKEFYIFSFGFMKKPEARVMEMETATVIWSVILAPKYPITNDILEFVAANPSYKAVNKDLWTMTLEFCVAMENINILEWNDDESWPSLLDEFVAWKKKTGGVMDSQGDVAMG